MLKLARHAGLLSHSGEVLGEGKWSPIIDRARWEAAQAAITSRSNGGRVPRRSSLLTGLVACGKCGATMVRSSKGRRGMVIWRCNAGPGKPGCGNVAINAPRLEALLTEKAIEYVDNADLAQLVGETTPDLSDITKALDKLDRDEQRLAKSQGTITRRLFEMTAANIEAERAELRARLARESKRSVLVAYTGQAGLLRRAWETLSVDERRAVIRESLGPVTILPRGRSGGRFDTTRVVIGPMVKRRVVRRAAKR
jgi:site-specific DNA recombinase